MGTKLIFSLLVVVVILSSMGLFYAFSQETGGGSGGDSSVAEVEESRASPALGQSGGGKDIDFAISDPIPSLLHMEEEETEEIEEELETEGETE